MSYLSGWGPQVALVTAIGLGACGPVPLPQTLDDTGDSTTGGVGDSTGTPGTTSPQTSGDSTTAPDDTVDGWGLEPDLPSEDSGSTFIIDETDGGCLCECDVFAQDCPSGDKCIPWANDGGNTWNAVRCSPVVEEPAGLGEPCTVEVSPVSGFDSCDLGLMCWNVDADTLEGTCIALCGGSPDAPECPGESECQLSADGPLALCLATCNPLADDCAEGEQCAPVNSDFRCVGEIETPLAYGEPCMFTNECESGLTCIDGGVADCTGDSCCTSFCDLSDGDPNPSCPDAATGQVCTAWYPENPPEGYENVGVCVEGGA